MSQTANTELLRAIRQIVREEVANANRSRATSPVGIAAPVEGDPCDEATNRGSMDPIRTESSGESTTSEEDLMERGRQNIRRMKLGLPPISSSRARTTKRKASR